MKPMEDSVKLQIDEMTYYQMLSRWRFGVSGDTMFQKETGKYFSKVMREKKEKLAHSEQVQISKNIGWG